MLNSAWCKKYCTADTALLLVRIAVGITFIAHGWQKAANMEMIIAAFSGMGFPAFLTYLVTIIELVGGVLILIGAYTTYASFFIALVMLGAILFVKWGQPFLGAWELDFILLFAALALIAGGGGKYSVKRVRGE